ncbi:MAG: DUF962 domain-containing protein [Myxococcota bacterium]|nr:DUF962 domain-containing protein [Myxococcota bacterium]
MRSADEWFDAYGESHQNPTNEVIHWICVPAIVFATLGLLWCVPLPFAELVFGADLAAFANLGTLTMIGLLFGFYARLSLNIAAFMLLFTALCVWGILALEDSSFSLLWTCVIIFTVAWIGQFIGHHIEGKKPSFLEDLQFLFVGPAWLVHIIFKRLGLPY